MERFDQLIEQTKDDYANHVLGNPLLKLMAEGGVTRSLYASYLGETYHLVRHTSRALSLAASRLAEDRRGLRSWFIEQAGEENGHELFCLKDLRNIGLEPSVVINNGPGAGAWGLVTQNYFLANHGNPMAILGVATATEGLGAQMAGAMADVLIHRYGIPDSAVTFLRSHSGFDQKHLEEARSAVNQYAVDEADFGDVVHARRMTYRYYGQLFRDVAESRHQYFDQQKAA